MNKNDTKEVSSRISDSVNSKSMCLDGHGIQYKKLFRKLQRPRVDEKIGQNATFKSRMSGLRVSYSIFVFIKFIALSLCVLLLVGCNIANIFEI